ncbi:UNVERIFIED_CONTAM: hypothetical protein FKN15_052484 [Acipenser sinensis]
MPERLPVRTVFAFEGLEKKRKTARNLRNTVADAAMAQTQTVYATEATPEQLEQMQQQGIQYDVITITEE